MTPTEKYNNLLLELSELLKRKSDIITMQDWQLDKLKTELAEAREENKRLKEAAANA